MSLVITDQTYAGEVRDYFITELTTGFESFDKNLVHVLGGIKKKDTVPTLEVKNFIQGHTESPTHSGSIDVDGRVLEPKDLMGFLLFNPRKFESHWKAVEMNPALLDAELPATAENAIVDLVIRKNKQYMDKLIWQSVHDAAAVADALANGLGDGDSNLIFLDGFVKKMFDDANTNKVGAPVALTAGNIVSKLEAVAAAVPAEVYDDENFKFIVSKATAKLYSQAQKNQANKGVDFTQEGQMFFDGKRVEKVHGIFDDTIVGTIATGDLGTNLHVGVNELDEETSLVLKRYRPEDERFFIKALFKLDVNYAKAKEIGLYTTQTFV